MSASNGTVNKVPSEKRLDSPSESYQDQLVLFIVHMHDEFHVPNVLIVLLHM